MTLLTGLLLLLAMDDIGAMQQARDRWGPQAMIGSERAGSAPNWTRKVGVASPQCAQELTPVGKGLDTWESAFTDADAHPPKIAGPFKSIITVKRTAWDNVAVARVQFFVDGILVGTVSPAVASPSLAASLNLNTTPLVPGLHVLCLQATDTSGNIGRSLYGLLFRVDPTAPVTPMTWDLAGSWIYK